MSCCKQWILCGLYVAERRDEAREGGRDRERLYSLNLGGDNLNVGLAAGPWCNWNTVFV